MIKRILYYSIQFTWNIFINVIGGLIALMLILTRHEYKKFGPTLVIIVGKYWGGFSLGIFTVVCSGAKDSYHTLSHEYGHSLQGLILGPLWLLLVGIPSATRYWYRRLKKDKTTLKPYDSIWFERTATKYGKKYSQLFI